MNKIPAKHIHVTCAIIEHNGLILAAQRSASMSMPLKWEFPGGKIDPGELPEECLKRELMEELGICVQIHRALEQAHHDYPAFTITLYPFVCTIQRGDLVLHEHAAVVWLEPDHLLRLDWAEADVPILNNYLRLKSED